MADPARASLVVQPFRYAQSPSPAASAAIKAAYTGASVVEIDTNLDATGGQAMADDIASLCTKRVPTFTFEVEGILSPEDLLNGFPRYTLDFDRHATGTGNYTLVACSVDFDLNVTVLTVRGS